MGKLVKINSSLVIKNSKDMNEYLKPMSRDIFLFSTKIANTYKLKNADLHIGDGEFAFL